MNNVTMYSKQDSPEWEPFMQPTQLQRLAPDVGFVAISSLEMMFLEQNQL